MAENVLEIDESRLLRSNCPELDRLIVADGGVAEACMESFHQEFSHRTQTATATGGLGFLEGETLKAYREVGVNAVAILPGFDRLRTPEGNGDGEHFIDWKNEPNVSDLEIDGEPLVLQIPLGNRTFPVRCSVLVTGGTPVIRMHQPEIFTELYPNKNHPDGLRVRQEAFYAKAYVALTQRLGIRPAILRINEPQAALVAMEMEEANKRLGEESVFRDTKVILTTHTPEFTALPRIANRKWLERVIGETWPDEYFEVIRDPNDPRLPPYDRFEPYRGSYSSPDAHNEPEYHLLDYAKIGAKIAVLCNGVAAEHRDVTNAIAALGEQARQKTVGIVNGSHPDDWTSNEIKATIVHKANRQLSTQLSGRDLFEAGFQAKHRLNSMIGDMSGGETFADVKRPTIGLVRRIVEYKEQGEIIKLIDWMCGDVDTEYDLPEGGEGVREWVNRNPDGSWPKKAKGLGANVLIGGKENDEIAKNEWGPVMRDLMMRPDLRGKFFYIDRTGTEFMAAAAQGCDVWLHTPRETREACGTSYQRACFNGRWTICSHTGGPCEQIQDGVNGRVLHVLDSATTDLHFDEIARILDMPEYDGNVPPKKAEVISAYRRGLQRKLVPALQEAVAQYRDFTTHAENDNHPWLTNMVAVRENALRTMSIFLMAAKYRELFRYALELNGDAPDVETAQRRIDDASEGIFRRPA